MFVSVAIKASREVPMRPPDAGGIMHVVIRAWVMRSERPHPIGAPGGTCPLAMVLSSAHVASAAAAEQSGKGDGSFFAGEAC